MQVAPEQGTLLLLLTRWVGVTAALELGTFTGYSSICIARGLAPGGRLVCCDVSDEWTSVARRYWAEAGVAERIELRLGPAVDTLRNLDPGTQFDLVFIDADKPGYPEYWELVVPLVRPGGAIVVDNVLRHGEVWDPSVTEEGTVAIRRFNDIVAADPRVEVVLATIGDGLVLARRRGGEA
jgi:caffeoyl-CoA O-methyltransferase